MPGKGRDFKNLSFTILGLGLLVLVPLVWFLPRTEEREEEQEDNKVLYWHCPNCELEMTCPPGEETKVTPCPHCNREGVNFEIREQLNTKGVVHADFKGEPLFKVMLTVLAVLAASLLLLGRRGSPQQSSREARVCSTTERQGSVSEQQQEIARWMERMRRRRQTS
jgi:hypothetical protein